VEQQAVLIVSDEPDFSGAVTGRWQSERTTPAFTLMGGDLCQELNPETFDAAIVGPMRPSGLLPVLRALDRVGKPVLLVCEENLSPREMGEAQPRSMMLRRREGWLDAVVLVMSEVLRRGEAINRLRAAERDIAALQRQATLGEYMLEMRHSLNNALTSVLGNSELLLLEPGSLSAAARLQTETIRNMSLRIHEVLQRFSSLEKELSVGEKPAKKESGRQRRSASAGM
jgi:signal transduction histidine kinase